MIGEIDRRVARCLFDSGTEALIGHFEQFIQRAVDASNPMSFGNLVYSPKTGASILSSTASLP